MLTNIANSCIITMCDKKTLGGKTFEHREKKTSGTRIHTRNACKRDRFSAVDDQQHRKWKASAQRGKCEILGAVLGFDWIELFEDDEISVETMKRKEGA